MKVREDGTVKVLDFGLAKAFDPTEGSGSAVANSPTLTARATELGVILGTAAYMAPEQARGKPVDRRADVWAFGVVLYEMLTGRRAFEGDEVSDVLAAVLKETPPLAALPADTPEPIRRLLRRCLEKDRRERLSDMNAARLEIKDALAGESPIPRVETHWPLRRAEPVVILAAVALAVVTGVGVWLLKPDPLPPAAAVMRSSVTLPANAEFSRMGQHAIAISPDGTRVAYIAARKLFVRALDQLDAVPIAGVVDPSEVFFSPDGEWLGFFGDKRLQKVAVTGGAPVTVCAATNVLGASWDGEDDVIVFGQDSGLFRVPASGGTPELLVARQDDWLASPSLLPGRRGLMFTRTGKDLGSEIVVEDLTTHNRRVLVSGGGDARCLAGGYLVYARLGEVFGLRMDLDSMRVSGTPLPLVSGVAEPEGAALTRSGSATSQFSVSSSGTLVFVPGRSASTSQMVWVDLKGQHELASPDHGDYSFPRLSPDGSRIAFTDHRAGNTDVFILEWARNAMGALTTHPASDSAPLWTPDGKRLAFTSSRDGPANLYWQSADGTGVAERLTTGPNLQYPFTWTNDGQTLLYVEVNPKSRVDIHAVSVTGNRTPRPVVVTPFNDGRPALSPDGRWLAYYSDERGTSEIFVRPYPDVERARYQVSAGGGTSPLWAPDGRAIFYWQEGKIYRVGVVAGPQFKAAVPEPVVDRVPTLGALGSYTLAPDGNRFLIVRPISEIPRANEYRVVVNWLEEVKGRLGPARSR